MRRRLRLSDVSLPAVIGTLLWACWTRRQMVVGIVGAGGGVVAIAGVLTRRGGHPLDRTWAPTERPLLVYLYSPW